MGWLLWQLLRDPDLSKSHFTLWGVMVAIIIGIAGNLVVGVAFSDMVAKSAPSIGFRRRISAYYYAQIAKYIPGRIAALLVQRSILAGPQASVATLMSNLELMIVSCWLCSSAALVLLVHTASTTGAVIAAVATVAIGAWLIRTNWQPWIRRLIRLISKYHALGDGPAKPGKVSWLRAACLGAGILILPVLSSYALLAWGLGIDHAMALPLTASLMLAWVVGVLAFVFPAGIGVREAIFFGLGNVLLSAPGAGLMAEVALASRLLHVLMDVVGVASFVVLERLYVRMSPRHPD